MTRFRARAAVFLTTLAIGCTAVATPALAASPRTPASAQTRSAQTRSAQAASGWLARQLVQGSHFVSVYQGVTSPFQGETIDAVLAFAATKSANGYGARAISWLEQPSILGGYIGTGTESYAGATAKLILAAEVRGVSPASFGKLNLISRLSKLLTKSGRYSDHSKYGDFSNAFSQSLAVIALSRHGGAPASAVKFLTASECKNGGFPLAFGQKTCTSDTDATAMDVQALLAAGQHAAANRGLSWLASAQKRTGGVDTSGATSPNANTTGLAGQAFAAGGWKKQATLAQKYLISLQRGCSAPAAQQGALAYSSAGFAKTTAVDATAQGILGLTGISLAKLSSHGSTSGTPRLTCHA